MKFSRILLALCICTGLVFAQAATTEPAVKAEPAAKTVPAASLKVIGVIVSIDAIANSLVVKAAKKDETISVTNDTKITNAGKAITLADLKADEKVSVHYKTEDTKMVATSIKILPKAVAKKSEAATPAAAPAATPAVTPAAAPVATPAATPAVAPAATPAKTK
jgi:hypothetical protein